MATKKPETAAVSKKAPQQRAIVEATAAADLAVGAESLDAARTEVRIAAAAGAASASDLTRAVDAEVVAGRLSTLSGVVAAAGINDIGQGAELLTASEDVDAISAVVGLMSLGDLERGLQLGRLAGELKTISSVVAALEMPILSAVLEDRGVVLQGIARDVILRGAATRALSKSIALTGQHLADLGLDEMDEGELRVIAAGIAAERSDELAAAGMAYAARGTAEAKIAGAAAGTARADAAAGIAGVMAGAAEVGATNPEAVVSEALRDLED
jgi:hypothetical protein